MSGQQKSTSLLEGKVQGAEGGLRRKSNSLESLESERETRRLAFVPTEDEKLNDQLQTLADKTAEHAKKIVRDLQWKEMQAKNEHLQEALQQELLIKRQREDDEKQREAELLLEEEEQNDLTGQEGGLN